MWWHMVTHGRGSEGGNCRMECVTSTLHTTSENGVSSLITITTADAHTSAASSRLNWRPCRFKWTPLFRRKTKSDFCACAITFQTQSKSHDQSVPRQDPWYRRCNWLGVHRYRSIYVRKLSPPSGFELPTVQPQSKSLHRRSYPGHLKFSVQSIID
jgi:hypothetical protein